MELSETDQVSLLHAFPAKSEELRPKINIQNVFTIKNTDKISEIYKKVDLNEEEEEDVNFVDTSGYFGKFYRKTIKLSKIDIE